MNLQATEFWEAFVGVFGCCLSAYVLARGDASMVQQLPRVQGSKNLLCSKESTDTHKRFGYAELDATQAQNLTRFREALGCA